MPKLYDMTTDRNGFFIIGGESSADFGVVISEAPTFERAVRKAQAFEVPGRNGVILNQQDAWGDVTRNYKVWLAVDHAADMPAKVAAFSGWLNSLTGYKRLEDSFEPEFFRLAYYNGGGDITNKLMQYGETTVAFTCRPERFYKSGEEEKPLINGGQIYNPTRFIAKPLLHIEGTGNISVRIGADIMTAQLTDYINIDCERMNAYRLPAENMNNKIGGAFTNLAPGLNSVTITGAVTYATIQPRFYTI